MIIQLEIPKEFAKDYANNRFDDFFRRVYRDIYIQRPGSRAETFRRSHQAQDPRPWNQ